jgi:hypothetical protein
VAWKRSGHGSSPRSLKGELQRLWTSAHRARSRQAPTLFIVAVALGRKSRLLGTMGRGMGGGATATCATWYGGDGVGWPARCAWTRGASGMGEKRRWSAARPSWLPALAAWHPWGLGVRAGPTVGSVAAARVPGAAHRALERRASVGGVGIWFDVFQLIFLKFLKQKWTMC